MHPSASARPKVRRIALLAVDRLDPDALCYALNACQRLDACLDVLTNLPPEEADRVVVGMRGGTDTPWRTIRISGASGDDLYQYAKSESGLLFIALRAGDEKALELRGDSDPDGLQPSLSWVMVESRQILRGSNPGKPVR